jgi:hypothetical protein
MKSQAFENMDPAIQDEFIRHVEEHKAVQQSQQLTQLMMGGTTGGQPEDMGEMQMPGMPQIEGGQESGGGNQFSGIEGTTDPSGGAPVDSPVG